VSRKGIAGATPVLARGAKRENPGSRARLGAPELSLILGERTARWSPGDGACADG
jgi:hypothetical protein